MISQKYQIKSFHDSQKWFIDFFATTLYDILRLRCNVPSISLTLIWFFFTNHVFSYSFKSLVKTVEQCKIKQHCFVQQWLNVTALSHVLIFILKQSCKLSISLGEQFKRRLPFILMQIILYQTFTLGGKGVVLWRWNWMKTFIHIICNAFAGLTLVNSD
jgi:hypothetical protein